MNTMMAAAERAWLLSHGVPTLGRADQRCRPDMSETERNALYYAATGEFGWSPEVPCRCPICEAGGSCVGMPHNLAIDPEGFLSGFAIHPADLSGRPWSHCTGDRLATRVAERGRQSWRD